MIAGSLQDKKYNMTFQLSSNQNSRRILVTSHSLVHPILQKNDFSNSFSYPTIYTFIPMKCRELSERILKNKPQGKTRMTHLQSYTFDSLNSSTLTFSIVIPLRGSLTKSLPHHIHISEKILDVWEAVQEITNSFWLMQWAYCGIR